MGQRRGLLYPVVGQRRGFYTPSSAKDGDFLLYLVVGTRRGLSYTLALYYMYPVVGKTPAKRLRRGVEPPSYRALLQNCGRGNLVLTFRFPGNLVHNFAKPGNMTLKFEEPGNLSLCKLSGPGNLVQNFSNPGKLAQLCAKPGNLAHFEEFDQVSWTKPFKL